LRFDVVDSGPGIPPERQGRIFEERYQLAPRGAGRPVGSGLGLAIVERLARLLRCPVELESRMGSGSRFSVSVERAPAGLIGIDHLRPSIAPDDPLRGTSVVVLDDDELVLEGMAGLLRRWGCEVLTGTDVEQLVSQLSAGARIPDLIVCDDQLGDGQTGIEAIALLRRTVGVPVPAFLISGDTTPERLRQVTASGHRLLCKPIVPMTLRTMITGSLGGGERCRIAVRRDVPRIIGGVGPAPPALRRQ